MRTHRVRGAVVALGLLAMLTGSAMAWRPTGWVYSNWPYAYDHTSRDWYWFSPNNIQWANGFPPANGWQRMNQSALAHSWNYFNWPYAYCHGNQAWHYFSANGQNRCVNLRTGAWSIFGISSGNAPSSMVLIPGGENQGIDPDFDTYVLVEASFYMDKHEVTKALWDGVYTWAIANGYAFDNPGSGKAANHPVHTVNWYDCVKWCNARSQKEGRPAVYTVNDAVYKTGRADNVVKTAAAGYRLPSESEWEYAARGGATGRRFPWGDANTIQHARANYYSLSEYNYDTSPTRGYHPTFDVDAMPYTSPVGSFAANGYGLHDMAGNVWEWCYDWVTVGSTRADRGGSWNSRAEYSRVGARSYGGPAHASDTSGFRVVLPPGQ